MKWKNPPGGLLAMSSRVRVYDLARELGLTNKELIKLLATEGIEVKSHSSSIDEEYATLIRDHIISERKLLQEQVSLEEEKVEEIKESLDTELIDDDEYEQTGENEIHLKPPVIVRDLADALKIKPNELITQLMMMNVFAAINQVLDVELVTKVCANYGISFTPERRRRPTKAKVARAKKAAIKKSAGKEISRPPVIACIGHVDHGKTSLLDKIRKTRIVAKEAGGITQHIGASVVEWEGHKMTFLDTPGHEAFTSMRARGAEATDIVILVVAADDGVMPQTIEAIKHAKAANVPIIVALNKMDLESANPDRVLVGLQQNEVMTEDWGGDVGLVRVSAITGEGIDELLERIVLETEMLELKGEPGASCEAIVMEAQMETGVGATASVLIKNGTLHIGDIVLCGSSYGKVKALINDQGKRIKTATISQPVKILGFNSVPGAGEIITVCDTEREAKRIAQECEHQKKQESLAFARNTTTEDLFQVLASQNKAELKIILRADVRGSVEAICQSLAKIKSDKISVNIIQSDVGEITENDVIMAETSGAIIMGFHARVMPKVSKLAKNKGVEIRLYSVIYELLDKVEALLVGKLEPEKRETPLGQAEIKQIFHINKVGKICGCFVNEGLIRVGASARVTRDNELIYNGLVKTLKRFQDEVKEVRSGLECGICLDNFEDFEVGDTIEVVTIQEVAASL